MARSEIELIQRVESIPPNKNAANLVEKIFDDVLESYKSQAYHSVYHEYAKIHGYPLPKHILENEFYISRKRLEKKLLSRINAEENIVVLGCEGSGKTTLIHRVVGTRSDPDRFIYVDTSDLNAPANNGMFLSEVIRRLLEAISATLTKEDEEKFENWIFSLIQKSTVNKARFSNDRNEEVFENILFWKNVIKEQKIYFVLDNIDSLSVTSAEDVFSYLNRLNTSLEKKKAALDLIGRGPLRYLVSCRTTTYEHISSISTGMFVNSEPKLVLAEDDLRENFSIPDLMQNFLVKENEPKFNKVRYNPQIIPLGDRTNIQVSFAEYVVNICHWLKKSEKELDEIVKDICGRSIRRMKVYGLRIFTSPTIAKLAHQERHNVVGITREDPRYLRRRLLQGLFDFRISGNLDNAISLGFPLNLFRVATEDDDFRRNPLLGVMAVSQLSENWQEFETKDVEFAKCLEAEPLFLKLRKVGYTEQALSDLFRVFSLSGLLRTVPKSGVVFQGNGDTRSISKRYIADDRAIAAYFKLICCDDLERSIQYFNASVRQKYECGYYARDDSFRYECLLNLVFITDIIKRERQLYEMNRSSGVALRSFSSRFKAKLIPFWRRRVERDRSDIMDRRAGGSAIHFFEENIHRENERLLTQISKSLSKLETVI
jgi:energy-coupling factor transporter ATP-binding protein EcfA2